jgi:hypothetical protein
MPANVSKMLAVTAGRAHTAFQPLSDGKGEIRDVYVLPNLMFASLVSIRALDLAKSRQEKVAKPQEPNSEKAKKKRKPRNTRFKQRLAASHDADTTTDL